MNRSVRAVLVTFLMLVLAGPSIAFGQAAAQSSSTVVPLTILHTNDTHSHLLPFSYPTGPIEAGTDSISLPWRTNIGGIARRATLVKQIREQLAARQTAVWLVDAGDFSDGTPMSLAYKGEADIAAMNEVGYTFGTLGNHEFNIPLAQTKKLIGLARFPLLVANAVETASGKPLVQECAVEKVGALRVGVFGLITRQAATYQAAKEGVTVAGEVETARRVVASLRQQADVVVLISHAGREMDEVIADQVPGIDVIVGGHSHSRLPMGEQSWRSDDLRVNDVNGTVIVQAHQWGGELGRLDLLFAKDERGAWHVDRYRARLIPVTSNIAEEPKVAAVVQRFWQPIAAEYGVTVGTAGADFTSRGSDEAQYNLFADAVRETFGTEIDLENSGGIRAPLVKGPIVRGDLVMMDPFSNTVVTLKIAGRDLKQVLLTQRPHVSGLRYRVEGNQLVEAAVDGRPLEDQRLYTVSTNSYFAGYAFKGIQVQDLQDTRKGRLDVVVDYVKKKGTVTPAYDGRRAVSR